MDSQTETSTPNVGHVGHVGHIENKRAARYDFSISELMSEAWSKVYGFKETVWRSVGFYFLVAIPLFIVAGILIKASNYALGESILNSGIVGLVKVATYIIIWPLIVGQMIIGIKRASNRPVKAAMIFDYYKDTLRIAGVYILANIIIGVLAYIGAFLVIMASGLDIPIVLKILMYVVGAVAFLACIYVVWGYIFAQILVVEKNFGIMESLTISRKGVTQHWFKIFFTTLFLLLIIVVSCIPLGIGLIWSIPLAWCVYGVMYRTIFGVEV